MRNPQKCPPKPHAVARRSPEAPVRPESHPVGSIPARRKQRLSELSEARAEALRIMSRIGFGCIERLRLLGGEPVIDATLLIRQEIRFGHFTDEVRHDGPADYVLTAEQTDFITFMDRIRNGVIEKIHIRHGLPVLASVGSGACA